MKNKDFIFTIIGLVLVLGLVIGLCIWVANSDKTPSEDPGVTDSADNGSNNDTNGGGTSTQKPSGGSSTQKPSGGSSTQNPSSDDFYQKGDVGYITKNNVTTFYVEMSAEDFTNVQTYCGNLWTVNFLDNETTPSSSYPLAYKYSIDGGETWHDLTKQGDTDMYFCVNASGERVYVSLEDKILIAYTQIENCSNPKSVYESLREDVFTSKDVFNGCCGAYTYYVDFTLYMFHEAK